MASFCFIDVTLWNNLSGTSPKLPRLQGHPTHFVHLTCICNRSPFFWLLLQLTKLYLMCFFPISLIPFPGLPLSCCTLQSSQTFGCGNRPVQGVTLHPPSVISPLWLCVFSLQACEGMTCVRLCCFPPEACGQSCKYLGATGVLPRGLWFEECNSIPVAVLHLCAVSCTWGYIGGCSHSLMSLPLLG